jgi:hypothetical protein
MEITNRLNLPEPLVNAVRNDPYNAGKSDISVTALIGSPYIRRLKRLHGDHITEDVSERIYALLGQAVHSILERAEAPHYRIEERLFHEIDCSQIERINLPDEDDSYQAIGKITLSGQFDLITPDGILQDYKVTSYFACKDGPKIEWERQLNVLRFLCWKNNIAVNKLQIVAILRDWSRTEKLRYGDKYPNEPVKVIDVPLWDLSDTWDYVSERIQSHFFREVEPCTPEERWRKVHTWAVRKQGAKRATKVFLVEDDAKDFLQDKGDKYEIDFRKGEDTRCLHYCSVSQFCEHKNV